MFRRDITIKRVIIATGRTDMRKGIDGLIATVRLNYNLDPIETGTLFLFCGRNKSRIKGLLYEGDGFCLMSKRLTSGRYCWPNNAQQARQITWEEYDRLIDGFAIDSTINIKI